MTRKALTGKGRFGRVRPRRVIDDLVLRGYLDRSDTIGLQTALTELRATATSTGSALSESVALHVLGLLEVLFAPARRESFLAYERAAVIAFEWWYRTRWRREAPKRVMPDMQKNWKLGRTQLVSARRIGKERARALLPSNSQPNESILDYVATMTRRAVRGPLRQRSARAGSL